MDQSGIVGVITGPDIKARGELHLENEDEGKLQIMDARIFAPYVVDINEPLENAVLAMVKKHQNSVFVTKYNKLVGIFTFINVIGTRGYIRRKNFLHQTEKKLHKNISGLFNSY